MSVNLTALSSVTSAAGTLGNLILVKPNDNLGIQAQLPDGSTTSDSFLFNYEGENTVTLDSDITDHWAEDNKALQDQIALKPEMIQTNGYIGELNDIVPKVLQPLKTAADKLTVLSPFVPQVSATALIAFNTAKQAYDTAASVAGSAVSAWNTIAGNDVTDINGVKFQAQTKQQLAFQKFYGYWNQRQLFTVQTPWAIFNNMAIKTLRAVQDEDTRVITTFEVTFKRMRFAETINQVNGISFNGRAAAQAAGIVDHGVSTPTPSIGLGAALA